MTLTKKEQEYQLAKAKRNAMGLRLKAAKGRERQQLEKVYEKTKADYHTKGEALKQARKSASTLKPKKTVPKPQKPLSKHRTDYEDDWTNILVTFKTPKKTQQLEDMDIEIKKSAFDKKYSISPQKLSNILNNI